MKSFNDYIVDSDAIRNNLIKYKSFDCNSKICAVVKADGYGIGAKNVVMAIDDMTDFYAVANIFEAKKLRQLTLKKILILNFVPYCDINFCIKNNISISVSSIEQLKLLQSIKVGKLNLHFAINTGMNRIGFNNLNDFEEALKIVKNNSAHLIIEGIFTHFFDAESDTKTDVQFNTFQSYLNKAKQYFCLDNIIKHCSASIASLKYKQYHCDMVRLGIILYGFCELKSIDFLNILSIKSKIICLQKIKAGQYVGYGKTRIKANKTIAVVPLGYADGIFRSYNKFGRVIINGKFCKIVGNICMDMFMVDVTNKNAKLFDEVCFMGDQGKKHIYADYIAKCCDTISYEILTNIKKDRFNLINTK